MWKYHRHTRSNITPTPPKKTASEFNCNISYLPRSIGGLHLNKNLEGKTRSNLRHSTHIPKMWPNPSPPPNARTHTHTHTQSHYETQPPYETDAESIWSIKKKVSPKKLPLPLYYPQTAHVTRYLLLATYLHTLTYSHVSNSHNRNRKEGWGKTRQAVYE